MNPNQAPEVTEVQKIKPAETNGKKDDSSVSKFEKSRGKFGFLSSGIKKVLTDLRNKSPQIPLDPEQKDMDTLSGQLDTLNRETEASLSPTSEKELLKIKKLFSDTRHNLDPFLREGINSPEASSQVVSLTNDFLSKKADFQILLQQERIPTIAIDTLDKIFQVHIDNSSTVETNISLKESFDKFKEFSLPLIHSNLGKLETMARGMDYQKQREMKLVSYLAEFGTGVLKKDAVDFLLRNFGRVFNKFKENNEFLYTSPDLLESLDAILRNSDPKQLDRAMKLIDQTSLPEIKTLALNKLPVYMREKQAREIVSKYNLDPDKMLNNWRASTTNGTGDLQEALDLNIASIVSLEQERPGISSILNSEFGINNFGRYPKDMLIAQNDSREKTDLPYGTVIYPYSDNNGDFYNDIKVFEKLFKQIKGKYEIRIFEVRSPLEMVSALNASRKKFGKISFAIIGGHGEADAIAFGESTRETLLQKQVATNGASALSLAFVEKPSIVLVSCSTGQLGGIGKEISKLGARVVGPEGISNIVDISAKLNAGRVELNARYYDPNSDTKNRVKANTFSP